jgi:hypothetical protein
VVISLPSLGVRLVEVATTASSHGKSRSAHR